MESSEPFEDLARRLRQGIGRELNAEAAENEALTELQRLRRNDMADALRAAMHRGDRVTVAVGGLTLVHPAMFVGNDYLSLDAGERVIDVRLDAALIYLDPRQHGGNAGRPSAHTFAARLAEHEQNGSLLEIVTATGDRVNGVIRVAATDHLVIEVTAHQRVVVSRHLVVAVFGPPTGR